MINGIGLDTVEISRVVKAIERKHFLESVFTEQERAEILQQEKRCASDFAGKEAVVKMFGTGFGAIRANEIEILREENGKPYINLYGKAKKYAEENGITRIHISITNTKELASAFVVGEVGCESD